MHPEHHPLMHVQVTQYARAPWPATEYQRACSGFSCCGAPRREPWEDGYPRKRVLQTSTNGVEWTSQRVTFRILRKEELMVCEFGTCSTVGALKEK